MNVAAGTHRVEVSLADDSALVDKPTRQFDVTVEPNQKTKLNAAFPWAKVQLNLLVNGKPQPATRVKLIRRRRSGRPMSTRAR